MGHSRIGKLPATRKWREVVSLIGTGADMRDVAAATIDAASRSLTAASNDPVLRRTMWLLTQIPLAAKSSDFVGSLRSLGLNVSPWPTMLEIGVVVTDALDTLMLQQGRQSDFGEIAQTALVESLMALTAPAMNGITGLTTATGDTRVALKDLCKLRRFGDLARDFFARLTRRCLDYYLSRELPNHVGVGRRFQSLREHRDFEDALDRHCRETTLIMHEFAGDWFSRTNFEGGITEAKAGGFAHIALGKIKKELAIRAEVHA